MSSEGQLTTRLDSPYPQWSYRVVTFKAGGFLGGEFDTNSIGIYLNEAGEDGWEVVSIVDTSRGQALSILAVLKRPV